MLIVLVFAVTLLVGVLLSDLSARSILSTASIFLVVGLVAGTTGVAEVAPRDPDLRLLVEVALFATLYTDAMRVGLDDLRAAWRLPGRALLLGMPLVFLGTAVLAAGLLDVSWGEAFLIGAILAPTDPVLANAIIGREGVPARLRFTLGVESGLNDGLALPVVLLLLAALTPGGAEVATIAGELALGVVIGVAVPYVVIRIARLPGVGVAGAYEQLLGFGIGVLTFAVANLTHGNEFLAAFVAGVTIRTAAPEIQRTFHGFGDVLGELLKLLGLLLFGAAVSPDNLADLGWQAFAFAALVLVAVRPAAIELALVRSRMSQPERLAAAWFGPKGFASVLYGLLVLNADLPQAGHLYSIVALVIAGSVLAHSSTDVLVAGWFRRAAEKAREEAPPTDPEERRAEEHAERAAREQSP